MGFRGPLATSRRRWRSRRWSRPPPPPANGGAGCAVALPDAVMLAAAHLDPVDGVMSPGHKVDATDLAALRTVLDHVKATDTDRPRTEINCTGAATQVAWQPSVHASRNRPLFGFGRVTGP